MLLIEKKEDLYTELKRVNKMSRKKSQPKKDIVPDPKFNSTIIPKLINNLMYDGKRGIASKIVYDAIEKIKTKSKDEPINLSLIHI